MDIKGNIVQPQNVKWYQISGNVEDNQDLVDFVKSSIGNPDESIQKEANARFDADKRLEEKIYNESFSRENQYNTLSSSITSEQVSREAKDLELNSAIQEERSQRIISDNNLNLSIAQKAEKDEIPEYTSELINDAGFVTKKWVEDKKYLTEHQDISSKADVSYVDDEVRKIEEKIPEFVPTKVSELINDRGYITEVALEPKLNADIFYEHSDNSEIHTTLEEKQRWDSKIDASALPTKVSQLENDEGYLTEHQSLDGYAKEAWVENKHYLTEHQDLSSKADVIYVDDEILKVKAAIPAVDEFVTRTVDNLEHYYKKSDTYTQAEVRELISTITGVQFKIVEELPERGEKNIIYLVPNGGAYPNVHDEYIFIDEGWECIGSTAIDLSNYYTKDEIDSKGFLTSHQDISHLATKSSLNNHLENTNIHVTATEKYTWNNKSSFSGNYNDLKNKPELFSGDYNDLKNKPTIFPGDYNLLINKPTIPDKTSQLTNDSGFLKQQDISNLATKDEVEAKQDKLPSAVKDRYLHTNVDTGSLEWSEVQGGKGEGDPIWYSETGQSGGVTPLNADTLNGKTYDDIHEEIQRGSAGGIKFPIGYVYISVVSTDPSYYFGGVWESIGGRFLIGADGNKYEGGKTGGEEMHTLTVAEMPNHTHTFWYGHKEKTGDTSSPGAMANNLDTDRVTTATGGDQPHNNMPPYLVVYMWKKVSE